MGNIHYRPKIFSPNNKAFQSIVPVDAEGRATQEKKTKNRFFERFSSKNKSISRKSDKNSKTHFSSYRKPVEDKSTSQESMERSVSLPGGLVTGNSLTVELDFNKTESQIRRGKLADCENVCSKITEYLYVSDMHMASDPKNLKRYEIRRVINCCAAVMRNVLHDDPNMKYLTLNMVDGRQDDISWFLCEVIQFIEAGRRAGEKTLLHCEKGVSRSCSFAIAYRMWFTGYAWNRCFDYVKARRKVCAPNTAFTCNLIEIGEILHGDLKKVLLFRCAFHLPHDPSTAVLKLCRNTQTRKMTNISYSILDPKGVFVVLVRKLNEEGVREDLIYVWKGAAATDETLLMGEVLAKQMIGVLTTSADEVQTIRQNEEVPDFFHYVHYDGVFDENTTNQKFYDYYDYPPAQELSQRLLSSMHGDRFNASREASRAGSAACSSRSSQSRQSSFSILPRFFQNFGNHDDGLSMDDQDPTGDDMVFNMRPTSELSRDSTTVTLKLEAEEIESEENIEGEIVRKAKHTMKVPKLSFAPSFHSDQSDTSPPVIDTELEEPEKLPKKSPVIPKLSLILHHEDASHLNISDRDYSSVDNTDRSEQKIEEDGNGHDIKLLDNETSNNKTVAESKNPVSLMLPLKEQETMTKKNETIEEQPKKSSRSDDKTDNVFDEPPPKRPKSREKRFLFNPPNKIAPQPENPEETSSGPGRTMTPSCVTSGRSRANTPNDLTGRLSGRASRNQPSRNGTPLGAPLALPLHRLTRTPSADRQPINALLSRGPTPIEDATFYTPSSHRDSRRHLHIEPAVEEGGENSMSYNSVNKDAVEEKKGLAELTKPKLYQAVPSEEGEGFEWQGMGVYDDEDLIETAVMLLLCPNHHHHIWVGSDVPFEELGIEVKEEKEALLNNIKNWSSKVKQGEVEFKEFVEERMLDNPQDSFKFSIQMAESESEEFWSSLMAGF